jgi:chemotaxis protein histidine kinase CheA
MTDKLGVEIVASDDDAKVKLGRLEQLAKDNQAAFSKFGSTLSGAGRFLGATTTSAGALGTELANVAGMLAVGGPMAVAIAAATAGVAYMAGEFTKSEDAARKAKEEIDAMLKATADGFVELAKQRREAGLSSDEKQIQTEEEKARAAQKIHEAALAALEAQRRETEKIQAMEFSGRYGAEARVELLSAAAKKTAELTAAEYDANTALVEANALLRERKTFVDEEAARTQAKADEEKRGREEKARLEAEKREREQRAKANAKALEDWLKREEEAQVEAAANRGEIYRKTEQDAIDTAWRITDEERKLNEDLNRQILEAEKRLNAERESAAEKRIAAEQRLAEEAARELLETQKQGVADAIRAAVELAEAGVDIAGEWYTIQHRLDVARRDGNTELIRDLEAEEQAFAAEKIKLAVEGISQEAISRGTMHLIEGAGLALAGNPQAAGHLAAGAGLVAFGLGGAAGSAALGAHIASREDTRAFERSRADSAATVSGAASSASSPGSAQGGSTTINVTVNGPAFGLTQDNAERWAYNAQRAGARLEGLRP